MILENEDTLLGGLFADAKRMASALVCLALLTAFVGFLFAPALEPFFCRDMLRKSCGSGTLAEMRLADRRLRGTRILLWVICIATWTIALLILAGFNLSNY